MVTFGFLPEEESPNTSPFFAGRMVAGNACHCVRF